MEGEKGTLSTYLLPEEEKFQDAPRTIRIAKNPYVEHIETSEGGDQVGGLDDSVSILSPSQDRDAKDEYYRHLVEEVERRVIPSRWADIDRLPDPIAHYLATGIWIKGHGYAIEDVYTLKRIYFGEGFLLGVGFILKRIVHFGITTLIIAQLSQAKSFTDFYSIYRTGGEEYAVTALLYRLGNSPIERYSFIATLLALPVVWGIAKGVQVRREARGNPAELFEGALDFVVKASEDKSENIFQRLWKDSIRWFLPLHPLDAQISRLTRALRWDGRLRPSQRRDALEAMLTLFDARGEYTSIVTGFELVKLIDSLHPSGNSEGLLIYSGAAVEMNATYESLSEDAGVSEQALKVSALMKIAERASWPARKSEVPSNNKKISAYAQFVYGRYLQWWLGLSPTAKESAAFWVFKIGKIAVSLIFVKNIVSALIEYLNCPQKRGVAFTGLAPYAGKFDETCLNAMVTQFNTLPGQPASTLVDLISEFYIQDKNNYALDLSSKQLNGSMISRIIRGFLDNGVTITSLNVSYNELGIHDDMDPMPSVAFAIILGELTQLKTLDLSSNSIGSRDYFSCEGTVAFGRAIGSLRALTSLNISNNRIGSGDELHSNGTAAIGEGLSQLKELDSLDLSGNLIGSDETDGAIGTVAIGRGIGNLKKLISLRLSNNLIGESFTMAVEDGIAQLASLRFLDLSLTYVGRNGHSAAVGQALRRLKSLTSLRLSGVLLGFDDALNASGTAVFGRCIGELSNLKQLDLSKNNIGVNDMANAAGTTALGDGIGRLKTLTHLDLSRNFIGMGNVTSGVSAIGHGVGQLHALVYLDLSNNMIGSNLNNFSGVASFNHGFSSLSSLQHIALYPNPLNSTIWALFRGTLSSLPNKPTLPNVIFTRADVEAYFRNIPQNQTVFNFSGMLHCDGSEASESMATRLFEILRSNRATWLDLSNNAIGSHDKTSPSSTVAIGRGVGQLTTLRFLSLANQKAWAISGMTGGIGKSDCYDAAGTIAIGHGIERLQELESFDISQNSVGGCDSKNPNGTTAIGVGIGHLRKLKMLNLSNNDIGNFDFVQSIGTVAIGDGIAQLGELQTLDLSSNGIGEGSSQPEGDSTGVVSIGNAIANLSELKYLDLSHNSIGIGDLLLGSPGTAAIGEGIGRLEKLIHLDLSRNAIGSSDDANSNGTAAIGYGLGQLRSLTSLDLSNNGIDFDSSPTKAGTLAISIGLSNLTSLRYLNLSSNIIGYVNAAGEAAIMNSITKLKSLCSLDLSVNAIGSTGPEGPAILMNVLPSIALFNVAGMQNIEWSNHSDAIVTITARSLRSACESQLCFGTSIPASAPSCPISQGLTRSGSSSRYFFMSKSSEHGSTTSTVHYSRKVRYLEGKIAEPRIWDAFDSSEIIMSAFGVFALIFFICAIKRFLYKLRF